jgi:hypothetical protein
VLDRLLALIVDEGKWLPAAMGLALLSVAGVLHHHRHADLPARRRVAAAMNLFFGVTIGTMAFGHLLAVTTKLALGTLRGGSLPAFYAIGIVLAVPSAALIRHSLRLLGSGSDAEFGRKTLALNAWLSFTLLAFGLHNLPIAAPGLFNIGYQLHSRRLVGWAIVSLAVAANVGLFVAALVFLASGQSFEQFRGMRQ